MRRWGAAALVLAASVPVAGPAVAPLTDLPAHIGRYAIAAGAWPPLSQWFAYRWALIPNLGVDLIVAALHPLFGIEGATKIVVIAIPMLGVAAMLALAKAAHGRVPATALFALPLVYSWSFQFGFVNFCLAMALAMLALAGWIAWRGAAWRVALFAAVAPVLWVAHIFGWASFVLWAFAAEVALRRGAGWGATVTGAALVTLPLAAPVLFSLLSPDGAGLSASMWGAWLLKAVAIASALRDAWSVWDMAGVVVIAGVAIAGLRARAVSPVIGYPAAATWIAFLIAPAKLMDGDFVDVRLAPFALALSVLAIRPDAFGTRARAVALAGVAFVMLRLGGNVVSYAQHDRANRAELAALAQVPVGARLFAMVAVPCYALAWDSGRQAHLPSMAIVRRGAFANDQWAIGGQQGLAIDAPRAAPFDRNPSAIIYTHCPEAPGETLFANQLRRFDRAAFDYVWTIGFPRDAAGVPRDLQPVWTSPRSALYRVGPR